VSREVMSGRTTPSPGDPSTPVLLLPNGSMNGRRRSGNFDGLSPQVKNGNSGPSPSKRELGEAERKELEAVLASFPRGTFGNMLPANPKAQDHTISSPGDIKAYWHELHDGPIPTLRDEGPTSPTASMKKAQRSTKALAPAGPMKEEQEPLRPFGESPILLESAVDVGSWSFGQVVPAAKPFPECSSEPVMSIRSDHVSENAKFSAHP